ncbi:MAG TPA: macrolide ABC transporter ATP-binding protein [Armatimonadetes bacterium]|nr:macrolide ABC transporter ATP-binding protein [Armatimonadota bacterium]
MARGVHLTDHRNKGWFIVTRNGQLVHATGLSRTYTVGRREIPALRGVDFSINRGEFVVLLGPSGAGKTTTLNLVGGLDRPTGGSLSVAGEVVADGSVHAKESRLNALRREHLGFVFAEFHLLPTLSALENVQVPLIWADESGRDRAEALLCRVGLGHRLTHRPDELSGGEMQRVALARALINQPALLLADEPTANLDTNTRDEIFGLLRELSDEGLAILFATHDHELAERGDTVLRLSDGVIVHD